MLNFSFSSQTIILYIRKTDEIIKLQQNEVKFRKKQNVSIQTIVVRPLISNTFYAAQRTPGRHFVTERKMFRANSSTFFEQTFIKIHQRAFGKCGFR